MDRNTSAHGHIHKVDGYTCINTYAHSYLHKDLDKIGLTPALLVEATPCRWNIVRWGRLWDDKPGLGLAWIVSGAWVGLHTGKITIGFYLTLICGAFQIRGVSRSTFTGISRVALFNPAHGDSDVEVDSFFYQFMGVHLNKYATAKCSLKLRMNACPWDKVRSWVFIGQINILTVLSQDSGGMNIHAVLHVFQCVTQCKL